MVLEDATRGSDFVRVREKGRSGRRSGTFLASLSHRYRFRGCRELGVCWAKMLVLIVDLPQFERVCVIHLMKEGRRWNQIYKGRR